MTGQALPWLHPFPARHRVPVFLHLAGLQRMAAGGGRPLERVPAPVTHLSPRSAALVLSVACALHAPAQAQSADLVRLLNTLRAPGGACAVSAPPLVRRDTLDAVAAQLARGSALEDAVRAVGDRMNEVQVMRFTGPRRGPRVEAMVASRLCVHLAQPRLSALGVFAQGDESWVVLGEPFAPVVGLTAQQVQARMLALVNAARAQPRTCGATPQAAAPPVRWSQALELAASAHAADMAAQDYFSHTAKDGSTPAQRVTRAGYRYRMTGENIAGGQLTPEEAVAGWLKSPGHCENLMNRDYQEMAVAYAVNARARLGVYWVQQFGTQR